MACPLLAERGARRLLRYAGPTHRGQRILLRGIVQSSPSNRWNGCGAGIPRTRLPQCARIVGNPPVAGTCPYRLLRHACMARLIGHNGRACGGSYTALPVRAGPIAQNPGITGGRRNGGGGEWRCDTKGRGACVRWGRRVPVNRCAGRCEGRARSGTRYDPKGGHSVPARTRFCDPPTRAGSLAARRSPWWRQRDGSQSPCAPTLVE